MHCSLAARDLRDAARLIRRVRDTGVRFPILNHVLVAVSGDRAELSATNLDIHLTLALPLAGPSTEGSFTLPRTELNTLAKAADKDSTVRFEATAGNLVIHLTTRKLPSRRECRPLDPGEFPAAPEVDGAASILPTATLDTIRLVRCAASRDETRHVLNGVFLDPFQGGDVVATDGRRLVVSPARVPRDEAIIPNAVADLLLDPACAGAAIWKRLATEEEGNIASLVFDGGRTTVRFKLVDGAFPDWRRIMPAPDTRQASFTFAPGVASSLIDWLRSAPNESVRLEPAGPHRLTCTRITAENESIAILTVPAAIDGSPPARVAFNGSYLADALALGLLTVDLIDDISPGVATNGTTRCVVMPMRVTAPAEEPPADPESGEAPGPPDSPDPEQS